MSNEFYVECYLDESSGPTKLADLACETTDAAVRALAGNLAGMYRPGELLKLPKLVQSYVREGRLSVGHAKVILGLATEKLQTLAAERAIKEALNVRQIEGVVARLQARETSAARPGILTAPTTDAHVTRLQDRLRERLGTKVQLRYHKGKGALEIAFYSDAELERILQVLGLPPE